MRFFFTPCLMLSFWIAQAQISAITNTGDEVILYEDGTWKYLTETSEVSTEIRVNPTEYSKSNDLTFLVKSKKTNIGVYIDPKIWSFSKPEESSASEYDFQMKGEDLYGMIITEKAEIPILTLKTVALQNAKSVSPDLRLIDEEWRKVNGNDLLMLKMGGTIQGMKFVYYGYYFSSSKGTVQYVFYTFENLLDQYSPRIEAMLNGLTTINE